MSSEIIPTNPVQGNATTSSVRFNFEKAHDEINALQRMSTEVKETSSSDGISYTATFTDAVVLGEGVRVSVEINRINANTAPTLNANGTGAKTIVRQDGSALVAGDLKAGQYVDLMYAATGGSGISDKWVWLNSLSESANLTSPSLTSANIAAGALSGDFSGAPNFTGNPSFAGAPTSTTAAAGTNTTQIATTAFALANNGVQVAGQFRLNATINNFPSTPNIIGAGSGTGTFVEATQTYTRIGSAITNTSGVFTFPETGIYLVVYQTSHVLGEYEYDIHNLITVAEDWNGSSGTFNPVSSHQLGSRSQVRASGVCFGLIDIENTSNHAVRFVLDDVAAAATSLEGSSSETITGITFVKLANT